MEAQKLIENFEAESHKVDVVEKEALELAQVISHFLLIFILKCQLII